MERDKKSEEKDDVAKEFVTMAEANREELCKATAKTNNKVDTRVHDTSGAVEISQKPPVPNTHQLPSMDQWAVSPIQYVYTAQEFVRAEINEGGIALSIRREDEVGVTSKMIAVYNLVFPSNTPQKHIKIDDEERQLSGQSWSFPHHLRLRRISLLKMLSLIPLLLLAYLISDFCSDGLLSGVVLRSRIRPNDPCSEDWTVVVLAITK